MERYHGLEVRMRICLLLSILFGGAVSGQILFKSDTSLVNILATVHDGQGRVIRGLSKDDFRLKEDGRPQEIHDFAAQTDLPLTLALLVDTSGSMNRVLGYEQQASIVFLKNALRPAQDRATVFHFDREVEMLCGVEASAKALARAVRRIQQTPYSRPASRFTRRTTALYDAVVEASQQLEPVSGRKAMILLTDGLDAGSSHAFDEAVEAALRSDTAIYTILISPAVLFPNPLQLSPSAAERYRAMIQRREEENLARGRAVLDKISLQTGGGTFAATPARPVKAIFEAITDELRNQYRIGLACGSDGCTPGYHALSLVTGISGQTVQSRQGFFSGAEDEGEALLAAARRLALRQHAFRAGFIAAETVACTAVGKSDAPPPCGGTAKIVFDAATRTVQREVSLTAGGTLRLVGATSFGEFSVELRNIFRGLSLWQFHPATAAPGLREFDFEADGKSSAWKVWDGEHWLTIAYTGAIWIDPADSSVRRLRRTSTHLPAEMPLSLIESDIEFSSALLPARTTERICERADLCTEISSVVTKLALNADGGSLIPNPLP